MWNDEKEDDDGDNDTKDDDRWRFSYRSLFLSKFDMKDIEDMYLSLETYWT